MKKIYLSPVMDVVELKHQQTLLAGSVEFTIDDTSDAIDPGTVDAPIFSDENLDIFAE